jgi:hypothetical protein
LWLAIILGHVFFQCLLVGGPEWCCLLSSEFHGALSALKFRSRCGMPLSYTNCTFIASHMAVIVTGFWFLSLIGRDFAALYIGGDWALSHLFIIHYSIKIHI